MTTTTQQDLDLAAERPILTGITNESGECDRCGKELGRVFEVRHPDSTVATYGRKCCANVTGWKANHVERQARMAARSAVTSARHAEVEAAYPNAPDHDRWYAATEDSFWGEGRTYRFADWRAYMEAVGR